MIYSVDGNIVNIDGNIFERKTKQLTYQIKGSWFPQSYYNFGANTNVYNTGLVEIISTTPNSITVNYGDGTAVSKDFVLVGSTYKVGYNIINAGESWIIPQKAYSDGFMGIRNITFTFERPISLSTINFRFVQLRGSLPLEVNFFEKISSLTYGFCSYIETVPDKFPVNTKNYIIQSAFLNRLNVLNDSIFLSKLENLTISSSYNLSNTTTSNFFKINQLKNTLKIFQAEDCTIEELPQGIEECVLLSDLRLVANKFKSIPTQINSLVGLTRLYVGNTNLQLINNSIPYWNNLDKLIFLAFGFPDANLNDIPNSWKNLFSLVQIVDFTSFVSTNPRFNLFIENFYVLCTTNGIITQNGSPAPYQSRFRNISWGHSSLSFTGAKVAPSGYIQGFSNGTPINQGQKVFVLQNQYNHVITHA